MATNQGVGSSNLSRRAILPDRTRTYEPFKAWHESPQGCICDSSIRTLFIDTASLRHAGFRSFQELLLRSNAKFLRIAVSEIAWQEWRTHMRETECAKARAIPILIDELRAGAPSNRILGRLTPPALALWGGDGIDAASKATGACDGARDRNHSAWLRSRRADVAQILRG